MAYVNNLNLISPTAFSFDVAGGSLNDGNYTLISYGGSLSGSASTMTVSGLASGAVRQAFSLVTVGSAEGALVLQVSNAPASNLTWSGSLSSVWDTTTLNWNNGGTADKFYPNDSVLFNDTASTGLVALNAVLQPGSVQFNDNLLNYTLSGSGGISGSGSLTKNGSGTVSLGGVNTYAGGTIINGGTLVFASSLAIGGSGANVTANYGATAAAGYVMDQNFLSRLSALSSGVAALTVNDGNALSLSGFASLRLGAVGTANYSGTLTPSGTTYRLGGGGGTLTVSGPLSGANNVRRGNQRHAARHRHPGRRGHLHGFHPGQRRHARRAGRQRFVVLHRQQQRRAGVLRGEHQSRQRVRAGPGGAGVQYQNVNLTGGFLRGPGTHVLAANSTNAFNATTINTGAVVEQQGMRHAARRDQPRPDRQQLRL